MTADAPTPANPSVTEAIRGFLRERFPAARRDDLGDHDSLLDECVVHSLGVLELVDFLEGEFGIRFRDEEIVTEVFDSIAAMSAFVARRRHEAERSEG